MVMNSVVDGGDILAHYITAIRPTDDPIALFHRTVLGSVVAYNRFLSHLESNGFFSEI
jgi:hypothetical protein